jgi:hypothetical protein
MAELWEPHQLVEYFEFIGEPIDLRTVQERVWLGAYGNDLEAMAADVRRVWANCRAYTPDPTSLYHQQAVKMSAVFEEKFAAS